MSIFDKSFIHAISAEEAAVFDMHFLSNITPLFFVEVLADLEKTDREEGREALVKSLAGKTPVWRSYSNMSHRDIVEGELMGHPVELRRVPVVGRGRRVQTEEGLATVFDEPPEMKAKSRWNAGQFGPEEYAAARAWRAMLEAAPDHTAALLQGSPSRFSFRDLPAIKRHVDAALSRDGSRHTILKGAMELLGVSAPAQQEVIQRWKAAGGPPLKDFAPYTAHVVAVDLFRVLAMASSHIAPEKTSNYADIAYLYYLPFCEVFISGDRLHRQCAPLFMSDRQQFVWAHELRPHLTKLAATYLADPDIERLGLIGVSDKTTFPAGSFIGDLVRRLHPQYSDPHHENLASRLSPEAEKAIVERFKAAREAPTAEGGGDPNVEDKMTSFTRSIPVRRGRFAFMPKAALEKNQAAENAGDET